MGMAGRFPRPDSAGSTSRPRSAPLTLWGILLLTFSGLAQEPCSDAANFLSAGNDVRAEASLKECLRVHPEHLQAHLWLCGLYQKQQRYEDLNLVAERGMTRFPQEIRFYLTVGVHAGRRGDFARAIQVFSMARKRWPEDGEAKSYLAQAHLARGMALLDDGKNEEAEIHLRKAVELASSDGEALLNWGRALHNLNRSADALHAFDRALELDSSRPLVWFHRGVVLHSMGDYEAAKEAFTRQIEHDPGYPPTFYFRGLARQITGNWESASTDFEIAAERMSDNDRVHYQLGRCYQRLGRVDQAEQAFRRSLDLNSSNPQALYSLGRLLLGKGNRPEAEAMFRKAELLNAESRRAAPGEIRFETPR